MTMNGGCLCGSVRYRIEGEPLFVGKCYCTDCQKESGTGHITTLGVRDAAISIVGETSLFTKAGDSGQTVRRLFCPTCGTTLIGRPDMMAGISVVRAGTLDDSSGLKVGAAVFGASAPAWDEPPAGVRIFEGMPPQR